MPLPLALGRFNRRVTNPILWPIVQHLPGYGRLVHVGRRSGRLYRTPLLAFRDGDRLVVALTYGRRTDWLRNVMAAGRARFETRTATLALTDPQVVPDETLQLVPRPVQPVLRLLGTSDFLVMRVDRRDGRAINT